MSFRTKTRQTRQARLTQSYKERELIYDVSKNFKGWMTHPGMSSRKWNALSNKSRWMSLYLKQEKSIAHFYSVHVVNCSLLLDLSQKRKEKKGMKFKEGVCGCSEFLDKFFFLICGT